MLCRPSARRSASPSASLSAWRSVTLQVEFAASVAAAVAVQAAARRVIAMRRLRVQRGCCLWLQSAARRQLAVQKASPIEGVVAFAELSGCGVPVEDAAAAEVSAWEPAGDCDVTCGGGLQDWIRHVEVTESARAHSYYSSKQVNKTC